MSEAEQIKHRLVFQSPERIHAFGNAVDCVLIDFHDAVSIPREDSCFWELAEFPQNPDDYLSFNPQRGFMLLGTNARFWYVFGILCFNPQRGFMLLGTGNCLSQ